MPLGGTQRRAKRHLEVQLLLEACRRLRQRRQHGQALRQVRDRFRMRRALEGALAGPLPVADGGLVLARRGAVPRHHLGLRRHHLGKARLAQLHNLLVHPLPRAPEQRGIRRVLDQGVLERYVARGGRPRWYSSSAPTNCASPACTVASSCVARAWSIS